MTLVKSQVTAIFLMEDMWRNVLRKCTEICVETRARATLVPYPDMGSNMVAGNQQKHLSLSFATKG